MILTDTLNKKVIDIIQIRTNNSIVLFDDSQNPVAEIFYRTNPDIITEHDKEIFINALLEFIARFLTDASGTSKLPQKVIYAPNKDYYASSSAWHATPYVPLLISKIKFNNNKVLFESEKDLSYSAKDILSISLEKVKIYKTNNESSDIWDLRLYGYGLDEEKASKSIEIFAHRFDGPAVTLFDKSFSVKYHEVHYWNGCMIPDFIPKIKNGYISEKPSADRIIDIILNYDKEYGIKLKEFMDGLEW